MYRVDQAILALLLLRLTRLSYQASDHQQDRHWRRRQNPYFGNLITKTKWPAPKQEL